MRNTLLSGRRVPAGHRLSRRSIVRGALGGGALLAAGGGLAALAGCGTAGTTQTAASCTSRDSSASEKTLLFSNWPLYIDVDEDDESRQPTLDSFVTRSGIQVAYTEDINDNNEFFGKIRNQLAACQPVDRDLVVLTDWMAARLVRLGWLQKLDRSKLPNVEANLLDSLRGRPWDRQDEYAVPWQSGLTGIAYNGNVTKEVRSVTELLTRTDLKGRVTLLSEMHDTMGLLLLDQGNDPSDFTEAQFDAALEKLEDAVASGQIRRFTGNDYAQDLRRGDVAAAIAWSGDVVQLAFEDQNIRFVTPEAGLMLWSDNMLVPNTATHKGNAEQLADHYYDPTVAAQLAASVNYICPVKGAQAEMEAIDPDLAEHPLIFPDAATLARTKHFMTLPEAQERAYEQKYQQVIGA